MPLLLEPSFRG